MYHDCMTTQIGASRRLGVSRTKTLNSQNNIGFDCTCSLCSLPATERVLSDDRMTEVQHLDDVIGDGTILILHPQQHLQKYKHSYRY